MQNQISRRSAAGCLAMAPAAMLPALAGELKPRISRLWDDWRAFILDYVEVDAKRDAAEMAMPLWARPGPGHLYSDGSYRGEIIFAPLDITIRPPDRPGDLRVSRLVRRTLADCQREFELKKTWGVDEEAAKKTYHMQLRQLARVRIAQRAESRKVGLPELDRARGVALNCMWDAATFILQCESCCADAIAAKIIVAIWSDDGGGSFEGIPLGDFAYPIRALQPQLTGRIRADVAFLINRTDEGEEA